MRRLLVCLCAVAALILAGCGEERAQAAADARAGLSAAVPHADPTGQAILAGVDKRLPAAAGVHSADWPAPKMKPEAIEADPHAYDVTAPPEPPRHWWQSPRLVAAASGTALVVLGLLQRVGPMIPYVGPLFSRFRILQPALNVAWSALSHHDEVKADKAMATLREGAGDLLPAAQAANAKPEIVAALKALAQG